MGENVGVLAGITVLTRGLAFVLLYALDRLKWL